MDTQKTKYESLRKELRVALDSLLEKQVERLGNAVAGKLYTGNDNGAAELLEAAGLVKYVNDEGSMFSSDYRYEATAAGKELYEKLVQAKQTGGTEK